MEVEVVRSAKRRKTVQASMVDGRLRVLLPAGLNTAEEEHWVAEMRRRVERRQRSEDIDLGERAEVLARRYDLPRPRSIRWVDNQQQRWGSCTPVEGSIRISSRLVGCPDWVLDAVVVHELAHLAVADHSPAFHDLANRYPRQERATGYLMAKGLDPEADEW